jgi:hypothetical protein
MVAIWTKPFTLDSPTLPDKKRSDAVLRLFSHGRLPLGTLTTIPK